MIQDLMREVVSQLPGYEYRPQQVEMAAFIADSLSEGRHAIIEAGAGSGKSFGYLIPILESGKKAVISTGTIALQEQLLNKDIPFLQQGDAEPATMAFDPTRPPIDQLIRLIRDLECDSGDRSELPFMVDRRLW